jgi:hypothetical protein
MGFYDKRMTDAGYTSKVLEQRNFQPSDKLSLKAVQGECYQAVVVRETRIASPYGWDGGAAARDGAWASWGPDHDLQSASGVAQHADGYGAATIDMGCLMFGSTPGGTMRSIALHLDTDPDDWTQGVAPAFYVRIYKKVIGADKALAMWNAKKAQTIAHGKRLGDMASQCMHVEDRYSQCVHGHRPADYPKGRTCLEAASAERENVGQTNSCRLD